MLDGDSGWSTFEYPNGIARREQGRYRRRSLIHLRVLGNSSVLQHPTFIAQFLLLSPSMLVTVAQFAASSHFRSRHHCQALSGLFTTFHRLIVWLRLCLDSMLADFNFGRQCWRIYSLDVATANTPSMSTQKQSATKLS